MYSTDNNVSQSLCEDPTCINMCQGGGWAHIVTKKMFFGHITVTIVSYFRPHETESHSKHDKKT